MNSRRMIPLLAALASCDGGNAPRPAARDSASIEMSGDMTSHQPGSSECGGQGNDQLARAKFDPDLDQTLRGLPPPDQKLDIFLRAESANDAECVAGYWRRHGDEQAWSAIRSVLGKATPDQILDLGRFWVITRVALNKPSPPTPPPALKVAPKP